MATGPLMGSGGHAWRLLCCQTSYLSVAVNRLNGSKDKVVYGKFRIAHIKQGDYAVVRQGDFPVVQVAVIVRVQIVGYSQALGIEILLGVYIESPKIKLIFAGRVVSDYIAAPQLSPGANTKISSPAPPVSWSAPSSTWNQLPSAPSDKPRRSCFAPPCCEIALIISHGGLGTPCFAPGCAGPGPPYGKA